MTPTTLSALPGKRRDAQKVFDRTGGPHAAALFTPRAEMLTLGEDVGRADRVIMGAAL